MRQFFLVETTTKDKLIHQGILYKPSRPAFANPPAGEAGASAGKAILWVHGLTSNFYGNLALLNAFAQASEKGVVGIAVFNNRGHDMVTGIKKLDKRKSKGYTGVIGGSGYEDFTKCVFDIDAGITFLTDHGFKSVVLAGHSTGANKVCYYAGKRSDSRVCGVVLASPISDRLVPKGKQEKHQESLLQINRLIDSNKGDELLLDKHFFPLTPKRYVSLFSPGSEEDVFDYGDESPQLKYYSRIRKPLLVIFGEKDASRDRPMKKIQKVFDSHTNSTQYKSILIKNGLHSFNGLESELANEIFTWAALK